MQAEDESQWENPNTLSGAYGVSTDPIWSGGGKGVYTSSANAMWLTVKTCSRVKVITTTAAGLGSWRLRLTRLSDMTVVYNQVKSQATAPYPAAGTPTNLAVGFMDSGDLPNTSYRIELICDSPGSNGVSFDCLSLTVPVGAGGGDGPSGLPAGFQGIVAPLTLEENDPRIVLTIGPSGTWPTYNSSDASAGSMRYSAPEGPGALMENFHPTITTTQGGQFYGTGLEYWAIRAPTALALISTLMALW